MYNLLNDNALGVVVVGVTIISVSFITITYICLLENPFRSKTSYNFNFLLSHILIFLQKVSGLDTGVPSKTLKSHEIWLRIRISSGKAVYIWEIGVESDESGKNILEDPKNKLPDYLWTNCIIANGFK